MSKKLEIILIVISLFLIPLSLLLAYNITTNLPTYFSTITFLLVYILSVTSFLQLDNHSKVEKEELKKKGAEKDASIVVLVVSLMLIFIISVLNYIFR
jgi:uncharacterized membrane protein